MVLTDGESTSTMRGSAPTLHPGRFKVKETAIPKFVPLHARIHIDRKAPGSETLTLTIDPSEGGQWGPEELIYNETEQRWVAMKGSQCVTFVELLEGDRKFLHGYFGKDRCVYKGGAELARVGEDPDVGVWGAESPPKLPDPGAEGEG